MVRSISERDAAALLEVVSEIDTLDDPLAFPPRFLARLAGLIDNPAAAYSVLDRRNECSVFYSEWERGEEIVEVGDDGDTTYWRLRHSHPVCSYRERENAWSTPHTVSDFATLREFRRTEIWNEIYRDAGIDYWLDVGLPVEHGCTRIFVFARGGHDFDERAKVMLELLRPHLIRRAARVTATERAVEALAGAFEEGGEADDVVLATTGGTIEFASPRSRALLNRYFGITDGTLPASLLHGTVVGRAPGGRLTVHTAAVDGLVVLLLGEDDDRADLLTPRQREILAAVTEGLTDLQIAERLGIAAATVNKHLESIYERLDVHTRTAAAGALRR